jgi:hypothetical protein
VVPGIKQRKNNLTPKTMITQEIARQIFNCHQEIKSAKAMKSFKREAFSFLMERIPNSKKILLKIITAVLIQKADGKGNFSQNESPIETMYADVKPAKSIITLNIPTYTRFFLTFSWISGLYS